MPCPGYNNQKTSVFDQAITRTQACDQFAFRTLSLIMNQSSTWPKMTRTLSRDLIKGITLPAPNDPDNQVSPDDVYLFPASDGKQLVFVARVDDQAINPAYLCVALQKRCASINRTSESKLFSLCQRMPHVQECPISASPPDVPFPDIDPPIDGKSAQPKPSSTNTLVAIIVAMAVFALFLLGFVIALTRAAKRRLRAEYRKAARQPGGDVWDEDDDELAQMYMYGNANAGGPRHVQNPLYCAMQGDDEAHMDGKADMGGPRPVENPLYSAMQSGDDTDMPTIENEIYESGLASDDLTQPTWMESTDDDNSYADIDASRKTDPLHVRRPTGSVGKQPELWGISGSRRNWHSHPYLWTCRAACVQGCVWCWREGQSIGRTKLESKGRNPPSTNRLTIHLLCLTTMSFTPSWITLKLRQCT